MNNYAIVKSKENSLTADEIIEITGGQAMPLLWIGSEGRYYLVSRPVIQNLLELHESFKQTQDSEYKLPPLQVTKSQGAEISSDVGKILADE